LFPKLNKYSITQGANEVDTGSFVGSDNYKLTKERLKSSLTKEKSEYSSISRSRGRQDSSYRERERVESGDYTEDYSNTDIQSGLTEARPGRGEEVTVTHQVPTRTVFTVIERGETKSLFADVLETSLEVVNVKSLESTLVSNTPIYYSRVETKYPQFGFTEFEYEAIVPTPSLSTSTHTLQLGGRQTQVLETLEVTAWRADTVTETRVQTREAQASIDPSQVEEGGVPGQITQIIQNVLLNLLGGGGLLGGAAGPQQTRTQLITHTRTLLTTTTATDTVLIPVNYRGSEIYQTVTEHNVVTQTTTDYSVQTLLNFVPASEPFYPLAPTLHRAVRIVPSESPVANLANLYREPPAILSTRLVTEAVTRVLTLTTEVTTPLTVTLGAREVLTEIIQPTTTVITTTTLSTRSVPVASAAQSQNSESIQNYVKKLQLVKSLLGLRL